MKEVHPRSSARPARIETPAWTEVVLATIALRRPHSLEVATVLDPRRYGV